MGTDSTPLAGEPAPQPELWTQTMVDRYGPVVVGIDLRRLLGYRTRSAFERAVRLGQVAVPIFRMPGRRGVFALTHEVAASLLRARRSGCPQVPTDRAGDG